jgi:hypothetical protein
MVPQIGVLANAEEKLAGALRELDEYKKKYEELLPLKNIEKRLTGALEKLGYKKKKCSA